MRIGRGIGISGAMAGMVVALVAAAPAGAASINVTTTADETNVNNGQCALREAIQSANTDANVGGCVGQSGYGDDFILIPGGTYVLTGASGDNNNASGDLDVDDGDGDDTTIRRAGAAPVTVDGGGVDRVLHLETSSGQVAIDGLTIRGGSTTVTIDGGGIVAATAMTLTNSTVTANSAGGSGGGIAGSSISTLRNVTISGNRAATNGGGVTWPGNPLTLENVTVSGNVADDDEGGIAGNGGGLDVGVAGDIDLRNSVVAGNTDRTAPASPDCVDSPTSLGNNVIQDTTGCLFTPAAGDRVDQPARLGALAGNGGPTFTHALLGGSPAIDLGNSPTCPAADQRGLPRSVGGVCDSGAYERALCRGTVVNGVGTPGNDVLAGTAGSDGILAFAGNDVVRSLAGNDTVCGGPGTDKLIGGGGPDRLFGEGGRDRLLGGAGADRLSGGPGPDRLVGGAGRDRLLGDAGRDLLLGGGGRDQLRGGAGPDRLIGGPGRDRCRGGAGSDVRRRC